ncbi:MAG: DUF1295 domain-containing protein [Myxococcales bacterium]|nr:DUF1295 domain-containing protein [Myxococcales bacterium]
MHGQIESTKVPRIFATFLHGSAVAIAAWLLLRDGTLSTQALFLLACSVIYFLRVVFGMFVLIQRRIDWGEALTLCVIFLSIHVGFSWLSLSQTPHLGFLVGGAALYLFGSYLNTGSEFARYLWKKHPEHKGKLYQEGLFRHSMHINYFGDVLLFSGFAMITGSLWSYLWPLVMTLGFVTYQIPSLDAYLAERYKQQFAAYAAKTKKFIPYIY